MKFLDCPPLSLITSSLDDTIFEDHRVRGLAEAYSCKLAGEDKHLLREMTESASKENLSVSFVPAVVPTESAGIKLMVNLISAMNASFPDFDFSKCGSESFQPVSAELAVRFANENLATLYPTTPDVISDWWGAIDDAITLKQCKILVFNPKNPDLHPYAGALWKYLFVFFNAKLHRLLLFGCSAWSSASPRLETERGNPGSISEEDEAYD